MVAITRAALARQSQPPQKPRSAPARVIKKKQKKSPKRKTIPKPPTIPPPQAYNDVAGRSDINDALAYDRYYNPMGREYDLGRDGAFVGFSILVAKLYNGSEFSDAAIQVPIDELKMKGFHVQLVKTEDACITELETKHYQVAWIISTSFIQNPQFIPALTAFHSGGGAVFLFADNTPYVAHASTFLDAKFGITLTGDYLGQHTLKYAANGHEKKSCFGKHEIFTGIANLYEGVTICHPVYSKPASRKLLVPIGTASDGETCIAVYDPPKTSGEGRLCLDTGFTKLFVNWDSAGTARYIVNASCWLLRIE